MKKTLLFIFLISATSSFAQFFNTGEQTLLANLTASISINSNTGMTTLTLKGPSNAWFAIGFGTLNMSSGADVFRTDGTTIVDATSNARVLPPADASQDWSLVSNTVDGAVRTIVATRANNTGDANDYVFNPQEGSIPLIYAHGTSPTYAYHGGTRGFTTIGVLSTREERRLDFEMYPNPSSDFVNVQLPSGSDTAEASVFDTLGRLVARKTISQFNSKIDVNNLTNGIYLVRVSSGIKVGAKRFVKN